MKKLILLIISISFALAACSDNADELRKQQSAQMLKQIEKDNAEAAAQKFCAGISQIQEPVYKVNDDCVKEMKRKNRIIESVSKKLNAEEKSIVSFPITFVSVKTDIEIQQSCTSNIRGSSMSYNQYQDCMYAFQKNGRF